jgi:hypothetical protein
MRSIVVKKKSLVAMDKAEARQEVLKCIATVISNRRQSVAELLQKTGSTEKVKGLGFKAFNAAVMNRLSEQGLEGDQFRSDMAKLVLEVCGRDLVNDGFFRTEEMATYTGLQYGTNIPTQEQLEQMQQGYEQNVTQQGNDWGTILSGSAAVLDSLNGIFGTFTGNRPQTEQNNDLNQYGQYYGYDPNKKEGMGLGTKILIGVLIVAAIVGVIWYVRKK